MKPKNMRIPFTKEDIKKLKAGDEVYLTGTIYTARDAAHKRLHDLIKKGKKIPVALKGAVIYYAGPTPGRRGRPIGSCGPTTSSRMDAFAPLLMRKGLSGMIGKGDRSKDVVRSVRKYGCVYFLATGGLGALLSMKVKKARRVAFKELGPEAIHELKVVDFPLIVGIDSKGRNIYDKTKWKKAGRT
ncbi:MAG: fumarate hydratase C-terminal domain-containing protein [Candidatus Omnitrophica bacterium]|nr:fumarate hydratase C-terminal domain-containing protein [Candidatus Omnitrophota bacterium]